MSPVKVATNFTARKVKRMERTKLLGFHIYTLGVLQNDDLRAILNFNRRLTFASEMYIVFRKLLDAIHRRFVKRKR